MTDIVSCYRSFEWFISHRNRTVVLSVVRAVAQLTRDARSWHPIEVTTSDMVLEKIHHMVMEDRRIKVRDISKIVGISTERVYNILHEKLARG